MSEERDIREFDTVAQSYDEGLKILLGPIGGDTEKYAEYKVQLVKNLIREVSEIRIPKNNAPHVLAAGVAYPLLPDLHISAVGTLVPIYTHM